jgi:hypothetical protein
MNISTPNERQPLVKGDAVDPNWYLSWKQCATWISENTQVGTTAQRPIDNLYNGRHYTDTTLNIYLTYINGAWRNGAGVSV